MKIILAVLVLGGCRGSAEPPEVRSNLPRNLAPDVSAGVLAQLVADNAAFAADLYRQARTAGGNLFMSPYSVSSTLAMTFAGAAGDTGIQIAAALHFQLPPADLHPAMNALSLELASREADAPGGTIPFKLRSASSLWGQADYTFQAPFLDTLAVNYGAGVHVVDFAGEPEGSRELINGWVSDQTNGNIDDLLPDGSISGLTRLVLTNALYFKAAWDDPFEAGDTFDAPFTTPTGVANVPTMHQVSEVMGYGDGPRFRAGELIYDGGDVSMVIVLPELLPNETGDPLALLEGELTGAKLQEITGSLHSAALTIALPKFSFTAPLALSDALQTLGMTDAFSDRADFSPINGLLDLKITAAVHQAFVAIDEEGTEAAAASAVVAGDDAPGPEPHTLIVDRPFLVMILDRPTGAILFLGRILDPR
jgi:serpin B